MSPKRILIISTYFPPQPSIASLRPHSLAKFWAQMGHDVTVLTTKKRNLDDLRLDLPQTGFTVVEVPYLDIVSMVVRLKQTFMKKEETHGSLTSEKASPTLKKYSRNIVSWLKNIGLWLRNSLGIFVNDRIPDPTDFWFYPAINVAKRLHKEKKFDWVVSTYAPPVSHLVAGVLAKRYGINWVADYRDLWIENPFWVGKWPFTTLEKYLENKYVGQYADLITTVSESFSEIQKKKFQVPVYTIENGYDEDDYQHVLPTYFRDIKKRIVYTGSIFPGKRDPSPLFAAIEGLAKRSNNKSQLMVDFEVLFFGRQNDWLDSLIVKYKVQPWVKQMGKVSRQDTLCIQNQANILLFLEREAGAGDGVLTGKLYEYLATRKPILGVGVSPNAISGALIEEAGVGIAVGTDVEKLTSILENFIKNGAPFEINPNNDIISRYTRKRQAERLWKIMEKPE